MIDTIYQELILDHWRKPHNYGELEGHTHKSAGINRSCGDEMTVMLKIENDIIVDVSFIGTGCAVSKASTSLMTDAIKGKTLKEVEELFKEFHTMLTADEPYSEGLLGKLTVFSGIKGYPSRVKCATMSWHTLKDALNGK